MTAWPWAWPARASLRTRLSLLTLLLLAVGLAVSDAVVSVYLRAPLIERVDTQLNTLAVVFSRIGPDALTQAPQRPLAIGPDLVDADIEVVYVGPDGGVERTLRWGQNGRETPDLPRMDAAAVAGHRRQPFEVRDRGRGSDWRALAVPRPGGPGSVMAVASLAEVDATVGRLRFVCVLCGVVLLALLAGASWLTVRAGLAPLRRIEETASAIAAGDLSTRVPDLAGPDTEVGRLAAALNGMLAQIERAVAASSRSEARMRRFVADVSHELRTPLFGIKGFAELYGMGGLPERADVDRSMDRIHQESGRLARLVEDLLLLAQLDEEHRGLPLHRAPLDLAELARDAGDDVRALDPSRPVRLTGPSGAGPPADAPVMADEGRLRQVVANLVGNVIAHTPAGSPVRIGAGRDGDDAVLEIEDGGPGLTEEQARLVFDRFYRVDRSRGRAGRGGAGLGLAIVRSLVEAHGGRVEVRSGPSEGATFRVLLPAADQRERP